MPISFRILKLIMALGVYYYDVKMAAVAAVLVVSASGAHNYKDGIFSRAVLPDLQTNGVDVVIPWVNCSAEGWRMAQSELRAPFTSYGKGIDESGFDLRDTSSEIRFNIRSYVKHAAGVVNTIYVVHSDLHVPPTFLRGSDNGPSRGGPRLKFVRHSEILPAWTLPTFDRSTIASAVHRIKGLGEWFIWSEDDAILVQPLNFTKLANNTHVWRATKDVSHSPTLRNRWLSEHIIGDGQKFMYSPRMDQSGHYIVKAFDHRVVHRLFANGPLTAAYNGTRFASLHTNAIGCRDTWFKADRDDYPCFRHGKVRQSIVRTLRTFLFQSTQRSELLWINVQGPGVDDCYGGQFYNKVNPLQKTFLAWAWLTFPVASAFETRPCAVNDQTTTAALRQLTHNLL
jgi:hypothetical protein